MFSFQVCAALRKMTSVLRLGVYRERIEKYSGVNNAEPQEAMETASPENRDHKHRSKSDEHEDMLTVTVERQAGKHLGIRLTGHLEQKPGIYIADIQEGSAIAQDGRLQKYDRILFINGLDVRNVDLTQASALIQVQKEEFGFSRLRARPSFNRFLIILRFCLKSSLFDFQLCTTLTLFCSF